MDQCSYSVTRDTADFSLPRPFIDSVSGERLDESDEEPVRETWTCPHPSHTNGRCIFHLRDEQYESVAAEKVQEAFRDRLASSDPRSNEFVDATLPTLDFHHQQLSVQGTRQIILDGAEIGYFDVHQGHLQTSISAYGTTVGAFIADNAIIGGAIEFEDCDVGVFSLNTADIEDRLWVHDSEFDYIQARLARFTGLVEIADADILDGATFQQAEFNREANFSGSTFASEFTGTADKDTEAHRLNSALISRPLLGIRRATERGEPDSPTFQEPPDEAQVYYSGREFADTQYVHFNDLQTHGADFRDATFSTQARFDDCRFEFADFSRTDAGYLSMIDTSVFGVIYFSGAHLDRCDMRIVPLDLDEEWSLGWADDVDLSNKVRVYFDRATISKGRLMQPDTGTVYFDVREATIGDITVWPETSAFEYLLVDRTEFAGFDFPTYRESLRRVGWTLTRDPLFPIQDDLRDMECEEVTYLKAKQGARAVGDPVSESRFFRKEMRNRVNQHQRDIRDASNIELWTSIGKVLANRIYGLTTGYGEMPHRVVLSYLVVAFALPAFVLLPVLATSPSVYTDASVRVTEVLLFGSASELPVWLQPVFRVYDRLILPAFVALLVFTLSRSIER